MVEWGTIFDSPTGPKNPKSPLTQATPENPLLERLEKDKNPPVSTKPVSWDKIFGDERAMPPGMGVQPTDRALPETVVPINEEVNAFIAQGMDAPTAMAEVQRVTKERKDTVVNTAMELAGNDWSKALTATEEYRRITGLSWKQIQDEVTNRGGSYREYEAEEIKKAVQDKAKATGGTEWFNRTYNTALRTAGGFDTEDEVYEQFTKDIYADAVPMLSDNDRKRSSIMNQLDAERKKTVDEGRDPFKIQQLTMDLNALGRSYTDENGAVIDMTKGETLTAEQQEFVGMIQQFEQQYEGTDRDELRDVFHDHYKWFKAIEELYNEEVDPYLRDQMKQNAKPSAFPEGVYVPKEMQEIQSQYRKAKAEFQALSKLYLANSNPADIKKDVGFVAKSTILAPAARSLFGDKIMDAVYDNVGPTERSLLDVTSEIMYSKDLKVTEEMAQKFDRSFWEMTGETASGLVGMLPLLAVAGNVSTAAQTALRLERLIGAQGIWTLGSRSQKAAAMIMRTMAEEIKLQAIGFAPGSGAGFQLSGEVGGKIGMSLVGKPAWLRGFVGFMKKPTFMTSAMYAAKFAEAGYEDIMTDKSKEAIIDEYFGGGLKEAGSLMVANLMFGFGNKGVTKNKYPEFEKILKDAEKKGDKAEAALVRTQLELFKKLDSAESKAQETIREKNLPPEEATKLLQETQQKAAKDFLPKQQAVLEKANILERTVPDSQLASALKGSKMVDAEGKPQMFYHFTNATFNLFDTRYAEKASRTKFSAPGRSKGVFWFTTDPGFDFGNNKHTRYLNFKNPIDIGNVRKVKNFEAKVKEWKEKGYDGITGYEFYTNSKGERVQAPVAASFGTQGIVKAAELLPFQSKNAETLRQWADKVREYKGFADPKPGELYMRIPYQEKVLDAGLELAAKTLEATASVVEAVAKGSAYIMDSIKESDWYKGLSVDMQSKIDGEIKAKITKLLNDAKPEVVRAADTKLATSMEAEAKSVYLPEFKAKGEQIAKDMKGEFIPSVKTAESIVSKKERTGAFDVLEVDDVVRGALILPDMKDFKEAAKRLKSEGYTIHNKRVGDKETGRMGVWANKREGDLGVEVQIHTKGTWEAQQKAEALTKEFRKTGRVENDITEIPPPARHISDGKPKEGSVQLGKEAVIEADVKVSKGKDFDMEGVYEVRHKGEVIGGIYKDPQTGWWTDSKTNKTLSTESRKEAITELIDNVNSSLKPEDAVRHSQPYTTYDEAHAASQGSPAKNIWVKTSSSKSNEGRTLMVQFTSELMGKDNASSAEYYASLYKNVPGYKRAADFWEIPQWQASMANTFKNADSYVVRDVKEAAEFIRKSGYKEVSFSVLDVTKENVKEIAKQLPDIQFNVGGYIEKVAEFFKDTPNVKYFDSIESLAKEKGIPYKPGYDYRHFEGTQIIPRLQLSDGCLHKCAFCTVPKKLTTVDKATIDSHVKSIQKLNASLVYLNDKTFGQADNYEYLAEIYQKIKKDNPNFQGFIIQTTANAMNKTLTPEFIDRAGIKYIELGIESYNDNILKDVHKPASTASIDKAVDIIRQTQAKLIPNVIIGMEKETRESYENTLNFLKKNRDIISHVNAYSLAIYEGTEMANSIEAKVDADRNENTITKSFHSNPKLHQEYLEKIIAESKSIMEGNASAARYDQAMAESREIYAKAYDGLESVNLEGSPAKTALDRKMKTLEIPVSQQKEMRKAWTETKRKLTDEFKGKTEDIQGAFKEFINNLPLSEADGLNIKLKPTMLRRVNAIDPLKPKSLDRAIAYFEKVVSDATFRLEQIEVQKAWDYLDSKTKNLEVKQAGVLKGKLGPEGLQLTDRLKSIRKNMIEGDFMEAQKEIQSIYDKYTDVATPISIADLERLSDLNFTGLMNSSGAFIADANMYKSAAADLKSIIKTGRSEIAAMRMVKQAREAELLGEIKGIIDNKPGTPVTYSARDAANLTLKAGEKFGRMLDWVQFDSWFTYLDKLSKFDKTSDPYQSTLNKVLGGAVVEANQRTYAEKSELFKEVENKAMEIFGAKNLKDLAKKARERTKTIHDINYKDIMGQEKTLKITSNQAYETWMKLQDMTYEKAHEAGGYIRNGQLTELGKGIENILTPELKAWANWQLDYFYPKMWDYLNPTYRSLMGIDMPKGEKYSPGYVDAASTKIVNENELLSTQTFMSNAKNGSLIARVNHDKPLRLIDGDKALMHYIDKMTYWKNWAEPLQLLNGVFQNPEIRMAIKQNFGDPYINVAQDFINDFSRKPRESTWMTQKWLGKLRNNFAVSSLSLKAPVFAAQMTSFPAYLEQVPVMDYTKQMYKSIANPKETTEIIKKIVQSPFMEQRYQTGWDLTVTEAMAKDLNTLGSRSDWKNHMMFLTKWGDKGAILLGGVPMYRYAYEQSIKQNESPRIAEARALAAFADATRNAQQAGEVYDLSTFQRANDFTKAMSMYRTAPMQYHRKVMGAYRNLMHNRGDVSGNLKTIAIYHVLLPQLFQLAGNGFTWKDEDQLWALALGNFNEVLVAGDITEGITNAIRGLPWNYQPSPLVSVGLDAQKAAKRFKAAFDTPQSIGVNDVLEAANKVNFVELLAGVKEAGKVLGPLTGLPLPGVIATGTGMYDAATGDTDYPVRRIMGYSENRLKAADNLLGIESDKLRTIEEMLNDTSKPTLQKILDMQDKPAVKSVTPTKGPTMQQLLDKGNK